MAVVEWTINNFSYWNGCVHEKEIEFKSSVLSCPRILLYPRGLSGNEEHLVVHLYTYWISSGLLTCIDSSGSLICSQKINEDKKKGNHYEIIPGLKFADVAARIRDSDNNHPDRFTLRWEDDDEEEGEYRLFTTIDVFDSSIKIDREVISKEKDACVSNIHCPCDDSETESIFLRITQKGVFVIEPTSKNILVSISTSFLKCGSVIRTEENEGVIQNTKSWAFLKSSTEDLTKEGVSLHLRIKIAPANKYKHYFSYYIGFPKLVDVLPTHVLELPKTLNDGAPSNSVSVLVKELAGLCQDGDFSDFRLRCGEVSFPTHKSILSARSPVFKAMLCSDMREVASDSMDIADLDVQTLARFLVFLYTGAAEDLGWDGALRLYYAADKYQVPSLKRECVSVFRENVSVSNVCDILFLADKHNDEELTEVAHAHILKNYNDVLRSEGWKTFMSDEPSLAVKTLTYFAEKNVFKVISDS